MDETLWGWKKEKDVLLPIKTDNVSVHERTKKNCKTSLLLQLCVLIKKICHV